MVTSLAKSIEKHSKEELRGALEGVDVSPDSVTIRLQNGRFISYPYRMVSSTFIVKGIVGPYMGDEEAIRTVLRISEDVARDLGFSKINYDTGSSVCREFAAKEGYKFGDNIGVKTL